MDQAQVLGRRIYRLEGWFKDHPGEYDAFKRDELRTLYIVLGDEEKALAQSDVILANQFNDKKTLAILSQAESSQEDNSDVRVKKLLRIASRYPKLQFVAAAARIKAGDLLKERGQVRTAVSIYRQAFGGPKEYAKLARARTEETGRIES